MLSGDIMDGKTGGHFTELFHASGQRGHCGVSDTSLSFMVHRLRTSGKQVFTAESLTSIFVSLCYERVFQFSESYATSQKLNT